jgi:hypothetical protein
MRIDERDMDFGAFSGIGKAFADIVRVFGVGFKDILGRLWIITKEIWTNLAFARMNKLRAQVERDLILTPEKFSDDQRRELENQFREASQNFANRFNKLSSDLENHKSKISTNYQQIMRPIQEDLLLSPAGVFLFLAAPPAYMMIAGSKMLSDPNPLGVWGKSEIGRGFQQMTALTLPQMTAVSRDTNAKLDALMNLFKIQRGALGEGLKEGPKQLKEQASLTQEQQRQIIFDFLDVSGFNARAYSDALQMLEDRLKAIPTAYDDFKDQLDFFLAVAKANDPKDLERIMDGASGKKLGFSEALDKQVDEILKNPKEVEGIIAALKLKDPDPETVKAEVKQSIYETMFAGFKRECEQSVRLIERGVYATLTAGMPTPAESELWELCDEIDLGKRWKAALKKFISDSHTLR